MRRGKDWRGQKEVKDWRGRPGGEDGFGAGYQVGGQKRPVRVFTM
jgi:hypothetical protein